MIRIDMQMPENCASCMALRIEKDFCQCLVDGRYLYEDDKTWMTEQRPNWCPLKDEHDMPCFNCPMQPIRPTYRDNKVYCGQCGKRIPLKINANYCHKCGREINWAP